MFFRVSVRRKSIASPCKAMPLQIRSKQLLGNAARFISQPFLRKSVRCPSQHIRRQSSRSISILCNSFARRIYAIPLLLTAMHFHCRANPLRCSTLLFRRETSQLFAIRLRGVTARFSAVAARYTAPPCPGVASLGTASRGSALPMLCIAPLHVALALLYLISSQVKRPFPLLRHWPMPEKRP